MSSPQRQDQKMIQLTKTRSKKYLANQGKI